MSEFELEHYACTERLILTPNARISLSCQERYIAQKKQDIEVFEPLNIMPLPKFISHCWQWLMSYEDGPNYPLLSQLEINFLFSKAISEVSPELPLSYSLLEEVKRAWDNCTLWMLPITLESFTYTLETETFQKWCETFIELKDLRLTPSESYSQLVLCLDQLKEFLPQEILLMHFESFSPQESLFFESLKTVIAVNTNSPKAPHAKQCQVLSFDDLNAENEGLISWLTQKLSEGKNNLGVVVGTLTSRKEQLSQLLHHHFPAKLINISFGRPLTDYPLVFSALCILNFLNAKKLKKDHLMVLLKSPFINVFNETADRIALSNELEAINALSLAQTTFLELSSCHEFNAQLEMLLNFNSRQTLYPSLWSEQFKVLLDSLGFPGESPLSSHNYQLFEKFILVFAELAKSDELVGAIKFTDYCQLFKMSLDATLFQPQRSSEVKVHVLGLLEGLSLPFDALFLMGVNDTLLPETIKLSPFIPPHHQKELVMPKSSLQKEIKYAKQIIEKFKHSADQVYFSYFKHDEGNEFRLSPLVSQLAIGETPTPIFEDRLELQPIKNTFKHSIPLPDGFSAHSALLKEQALCPFRAYAKYRLKLPTTPTAQYGLTHMERGIILHNVLENFWRVIKKQESLLSLSVDAFNETLQAAIDKALRKTNLNHYEILGRHFKALEGKRLFYLCKRWLELEKERTPFEVIACEKKETISLKGLPFSLRIDRIDKCENGQMLLIDYKSGLTSPATWFHEPPSEPQLPLYALTINEADALVFFQLKPSNMAIKGISATEACDAGIKPIEKTQKISWAKQKEQWLAQLESLSDDFQQGHFPPTPAQPSVCLDCDFKRFCRRLE